MSVQDLTFSSAKVAEAAGMTHVHFRALLSRGGWQIVGQGRPAVGNGRGHAFTVVDAVGYAVAFRLLRMGAPSELAFQLGVEDCVYLDSGMTEALLHPQGENAAWFVYYPWCPRVEAGELLIGPRTRVADFFEKTRGSEAVVLDLFGIRDQVFAALGAQVE